MAIYYVRSTGGSNSNDGLSFATGWATLAYANSTIAQGDVLNLCSDINFQFDISSMLTIPKYCFYYGCDLITGARHTLDFAYIKSTHAIGSLAMGGYNYVSNIHIDGDNISSYGFRILGDSGYSQGNTLFRCRVNNCLAGIIAAYYASPLNKVNIVGCEIYDCVTGITATDRVQIINCSIHDNTGDGIYSSSSTTSASVIEKNRIYNNGTGLYCVGHSVVNSNVFYSNSSYGIRFRYGLPRCLSLINNIFLNNGYGVSEQETAQVVNCFFDYNCFYGSTDGDVDANVNGGVVPGISNVFVDPIFESLVAGSEDFSLQTGSPCLGTGYGFTGGK